MAPFAGARGARTGRPVWTRGSAAGALAAGNGYRDPIDALGRIRYMTVKPPKTALTQPTYALPMTMLNSRHYKATLPDSEQQG
eukprot:16433864-Heterocapsa_arctica.AAC.1